MDPSVAHAADMHHVEQHHAMKPMEFSEPHMLAAHDFVGSTFFIACNMMLAFTLFFFVQVSVVPRQWRASVSIAGIVTGIAWYNYTFMKNQWVSTQSSPTVYRYADWLITVPLQIVEFFFILKAQGPINGGLGFRLFMASLLMVAFGWLGELDQLPKGAAFGLGMLMWFFIIYETFAGEAGGYADRMNNEASKYAFSVLRLIVTIGWCIYPIGFFVSYLVMDGNSMQAQTTINIIYNLADLVNKGAFGLCIWSAAQSDVKDERREPLRSV